MDTALAPSRSDPHALAARIAVVIPAYNEASGIEACIRSLQKGAEGIEMLVLDGGSTDGTQTLVERLTAEFPRLSLHDNPRKNQGAAVNLGARYAAPERDILIRCYAHALYPEGFVLALADKLIETGGDSVVVPMDAVHHEDAGSFERALAMIVDTKLGSGGSAHRGGRVSGWVDHGHHAAFWRARFIEVGGYDEAMVPNEDAEFDTRLRADGGKVWLDAGIRLSYFVRRRPKDLWRQYWRYGRARARHLIAHRAKPRLRQMIPVLHAAALLVSLVILPISPLGLFYPLLYGGVLIAAMLAFLLKSRKVCALRIPEVLFILHTAWGLGFLRELAGGRK